jgi:predicted enzyme related to lactoylglutathione lyase
MLGEFIRENPRDPWLMISMKHVTGLGGFFFKARNAKKLQAWYRKDLGRPLDPAWGGWQFHWREAKNPKKKGYTVWSAFGADTDYFKPRKKPFMFNFRVASLRRTRTALKKDGVRVDPKTEESAYGKFGWIMDPEGNRIELWEPPK